MVSATQQPARLGIDEAALKEETPPSLALVMSILAARGHPRRPYAYDENVEYARGKSRPSIFEMKARPQ